MRIITGQYKGRHFDIPRTFKARPTTDFAKENIFNVLTGYMDFDGATALDLFAGTGSITLELLSRGCSRVVSVEQDRDHHRFICDCLNKLRGERREERETTRACPFVAMLSASSRAANSSLTSSLPTRPMPSRSCPPFRSSSSTTTCWQTTASSCLSTARTTTSARCRSSSSIAATAV